MGLRGKPQDLSPDRNRLYQARLARLAFDILPEQNSTSLERVSFRPLWSIIVHTNKLLGACAHAHPLSPTTIK